MSRSFPDLPLSRLVISIPKVVTYTVGPHPRIRTDARRDCVALTGYKPRLGAEWQDTYLFLLNLLNVFWFFDDDVFVFVRGVTFEFLKSGKSEWRQNSKQWWRNSWIIILNDCRGPPASGYEILTKWVRRATQEARGSSVWWDDPLTPRNHVHLTETPPMQFLGDKCWRRIRINSKYVVSTTVY